MNRNARIPKIIYKAYDLLNKGRLSAYYQDVKVGNKHDARRDEEELTDFLAKRGFNKVLEKNSLMDKEVIKEAVKKVAVNEVHSWAYTGGSYGEPLRLPYSRMRALKRTATFKYFNEAAGYQLGDPFVLIRAKSRSAFLKYLRNEHIFIPHDISSAKLKVFAEILKREKIRVLMGYPSVIYELALYFLANPEVMKGISIKSIITVSEPLEEGKRAVIRTVFSGQFVDRYSNEEVGLIGQQLVYDGPYVLNKYGVITEVVDPETLQPVAEGCIGKVLVTDLYNDLVPVVRYDTGDLAVAHQYSNGRLVSISGISGRVTEQILNVEGQPVSPLTLGPFIYKPLSEMGAVCQYQFAQTGRLNYELRLKANAQQLPWLLLDAIKENLKVVLGASAILNILFVEDILPLPSGKRPVFKNEFLNKKKHETTV